MILIAKRHGKEIHAQFDHTAQVYELYFDDQGEVFTGWIVDSIKDAFRAAKYIFQEIES